MEIWQQPAVIQQSKLILNSFQHWFGTSLLPTGTDDAEQACHLFEAAFPVFSHNVAPDPIYNYANRMALSLWEVNWEQLLQLPSRYSAEPVAQADRIQLLAETMQRGYRRNAQGVRISATGKRYQIYDFVVWNLQDEQQQFCGQAATFSQWRLLES